MSPCNFQIKCHFLQRAVLYILCFSCLFFFFRTSLPILDKNLICIAYLGAAKLYSIRAWFYYCIYIYLHVYLYIFARSRENVFQILKKGQNMEGNQGILFSVRCSEARIVHQHEFWGAEWRSKWEQWWLGNSRMPITIILWSPFTEKEWRGRRGWLDKHFCGN